MIAIIIVFFGYPFIACSIAFGVKFKTPGLDWLSAIATGSTVLSLGYVATVKLLRGTPTIENVLPFILVLSAILIPMFIVRIIEFKQGR